MPSQKPMPTAKPTGRRSLRSYGVTETDQYLLRPNSRSGPPLGGVRAYLLCRRWRRRGDAADDELAMPTRRVARFICDGLVAEGYTNSLPSPFRISITYIAQDGNTFMLVHVSGSNSQKIRSMDGNVCQNALASSRMLRT